MLAKGVPDDFDDGIFLLMSEDVSLYLSNVFQIKWTSIADIIDWI